MTPTNPAGQLLLERNSAAAKHFEPLPMEVRLQAIVLTCMDPRVHPAEALGLQRGEAVVIRNGGGRVTPEFLTQVALLSALTQAEQQQGASFELIVMHHTDCGLSHLDQAGAHTLLGHYLGVPADEVPDHHPSNPERAVAYDLQKLRDHPAVPDSLTLSGLVLDLSTGIAKKIPG